MTRLQSFDTAKMPEANLVDAAFCNDLPNEFFTYSWSEFKLPSGKLSSAKWITDNGFTVCAKKEASCLLRVGEKCAETGCWIIGKTKNYWLKIK